MLERSVTLLLLVQMLIVIDAVQFPRRFSASVVSKSSWGDEFGCNGLPMVSQVHQDLNSTLWTHLISTDGVHSHFEDVLYTVPASTADPDTPEASYLTRFSWKSDTNYSGCNYGLVYNNNRQLPIFFDYPLSALERKEIINGVECEKWSNKDKKGPYEAYCAGWFPTDADPTYSVVAKAQYTTPPSRPGSFPVPQCTLNYTFTKFHAGPISNELFIPPNNWSKICNNSDQGLKKYHIPDRQSGYICISPGKLASFSVSLFNKPVSDMAVRVRLCNRQDYCIDGARCSNCVQLSTTTLEFGPNNWSKPQAISISYVADGDTQFVFDSPDSYLNNTFNTQFSTCACASKKCSNNCQMYCYS